MIIIRIQDAEERLLGQSIYIRKLGMRRITYENMIVLSSQGLFLVLLHSCHSSTGSAEGVLVV